MTTNSVTAGPRCAGRCNGFVDPPVEGRDDVAVLMLSRGVDIDGVSISGVIEERCRRCEIAEMLLTLVDNKGEPGGEPPAGGELV